MQHSERETRNREVHAMQIMASQKSSNRRTWPMTAKKSSTLTAATCTLVAIASGMLEMCSHALTVTCATCCITISTLNIVMRCLVVVSKNMYLLETGRDATTARWAVEEGAHTANGSPQAHTQFRKALGLDAEVAQGSVCRSGMHADLITIRISSSSSYSSDLQIDSTNSPLAAALTDPYLRVDSRRWRGVACSAWHTWVSYCMCPYSTV